MAADDTTPCPSSDTKHILHLVYITALIVVAVLVLFLLHVLGSLRRRLSHKPVHTVVFGAHTLSYALVSYTLGLMQDSTYYFNEFPVWAVCLLMLLGGTDNLMVCKLNDVDNWKSFHVKHFLKGALVVYIVAFYTNGSPSDAPYDVAKDATQYRWPLWAMLFVNVFQSCMRINSMKMASKSNLLAKNVKPIVDYMKGEVNQRLAFAPTMEGCRYIVAGEHRLRNYGKKPVDYVKITTVEKIWQSKGSLLCSDSDRAMRLKDICLSMALSKMLNRRFADFQIPEAELGNARDFVFNGLLVGDGDKPCERTFRVIEVELGFVHDLYYTRYPYLYHNIGYFALCLPVAMVIFCSWLTQVLFKKHKEAGDNISLCTTLFLMAVVTLLETFQLYLHVASDWFKVALIRSYAIRTALQGSVSSMIISLALRLKALRPWENKLGQYCLLKNYSRTRHTSNCIHYATLWLVNKARKGCKRGEPIKLSTQVKKAVIDSLKKSEGRLTNGTRSLKNNGVDGLLSWACKFDMVTDTILVWHVATTICKHEFDAPIATGDKQTAALSEEDNGAVFTASKEEDSGAADTASSLSQYCAYLVAFSPDLLPDHSFDSASILEKCIEEARDFKPLQAATKIEEKCEILKSNSDTKSTDEPLIVKGARLASQLRTIQDISLRWKVLSEFWAEMMLYISPCDDAKAWAHLEALARGGEFITHLWALLNHAGMLEREKTGVLKPDLVGLEAV
ncbi:unnamed protein product [Alopecurus aequalis]